MGAGAASTFGLLPLEQAKPKQLETMSSVSTTLKHCELDSATIGSLLVLAFTEVTSL
jgi:hypothetical protein